MFIFTRRVFYRKDKHDSLFINILYLFFFIIVGQAFDIMETLKMTEGSLSKKNLPCENDSNVEKKQAV